MPEGFEPSPKEVEASIALLSAMMDKLIDEALNEGASVLELAA